MQTPIQIKWYSVLKRPHSPEWNDFGAFSAWCEENGFAPDRTLFREDLSKPLGPDNCYFGKKRKNASLGVWENDFPKRWARTVNVFRRAAGLPLLKE